MLQLQRTVASTARQAAATARVTTPDAQSVLWAVAASGSAAGFAAAAASAFFVPDFRLPNRPPALPITDFLLFASFFAAIASALFPLAVMTSVPSPEATAGAVSGVAGVGTCLQRLL
jgi:hypothetical protein